MNNPGMASRPLSKLVRLAVVLPSALLCLLGCDGSNSSDPGPSVQTVTALCARAAACSGTSVTTEFLTECRTATGSLGSVLVDPESFTRCVEELSCDQLANETRVATCLDLDPTSVHCGQQGLRACTNAGLCREIDCRDACAAAGVAYLGCGLNQRYGYDTCLCQAD